jgi:flagellar biosynthesis/type III secretory pathway protein FliH
MENEPKEGHSEEYNTGYQAGLAIGRELGRIEQARKVIDLIDDQPMWVDDLLSELLNRLHYPELRATTRAHAKWMDMLREVMSEDINNLNPGKE